MYPVEHPARSKTIETSFFTLQEIFQRINQVTFGKIGNEALVNGLNMGDNTLPKRLEREFKEQGIHSLTFTKAMTKEEFAKFLNFLATPLVKGAPSENLPEFLQNNGIESIKINQLKYQLVSEDEVVVKSEVLEEADLKAQISKIIKENPDLIRDILLNKPLEQESYKERFDTEIDLNQLSQGIHQYLKDFTDDEVLAFLASGLKLALKKSTGQSKNPVLNETARLVHQLLQDREKKKLLPEIKKILTGGGLLEEKYFDFIFDEKWLKSQTVLDEVVKRVDKLGRGEVDFERFLFLVQRVIDSEEEKIRLYALDKLLSNLDSENHETRRLSVLALKEILGRLISGKMEVDFVYLKDRLYDKIEDRLLSAHILKDSTELIKIIVSEMMQRKEFEEVGKIIFEYNARLTQEVSYPEEVREIAKDFLKGISDRSTLSLLTTQLNKGVASRNSRVVEEILEALDKDKVAEKLVEIFSVDDRATRMSSLRVLSKLGQSSIAALSRLLSHRNDFLREKGTRLLTDEYWYKVRNAIYVLGNIPEQSSVEVLAKLGSDPDARVRLEVIKALEKIGDEASVDALGTFLEDGDDQVRKNAITSLTLLGSKRCLKSLIDHFHHNRKDKTFTLTAIGRIGGEEAIGFLLKLLSEEDLRIKPLSRRQREEIKITTLNILGKLGSTAPSLTGTVNLREEIEAFLRHRKRGIKALLIKDQVAETADKALTMIKNKTKCSASPSAVG